MGPYQLTVSLMAKKKLCKKNTWKKTEGTKMVQFWASGWHSIVRQVTQEYSEDFWNIRGAIVLKLTADY